MKGGIGSCAFRYHDLTVGAVIAVNCVGDIYDSKAGKIIAGIRTPDGKHIADSESAILKNYQVRDDLFSGNTMIGAVLTNAGLNKSQATKLAALGQNGIARTVRPSHTIFDGDTMFAMCTGTVTASLDAAGIPACKAVEQAILNAVKNAESFDGYPAARDFF